MVVAGTKVNTAYFKNGVGKLTIQWSVTGPSREPNGRNNTTQVTALLCAPGATDPACG